MRLAPRARFVLKASAYRMDAMNPTAWLANNAWLEIVPQIHVVLSNALLAKSAR